MLEIQYRPSTDETESELTWRKLQLKFYLLVFLFRGLLFSFDVDAWTCRYTGKV